MRHKLRGLYAIADTSLIAENQLLNSVTEALEGGSQLIQYRDKFNLHYDLPARQLLNLCQRFGVPLIINDNVDLAVRIGAAGVHLGQGDMELNTARAILGPTALIGISCHNNLALAERAQQDGASYVAFGSFFPSRTKPNAVLANLELITLAKRHLSIPLVAIGGITPENAGSLIDAGVDLIAVIQGLFAQANIRAEARRFAGLFN